MALTPHRLLSNATSENSTLPGTPYAAVRPRGPDLVAAHFASTPAPPCTAAARSRWAAAHLEAARPVGEWTGPLADGHDGGVEEVDGLVDADVGDDAREEGDAAEGVVQELPLPRLQQQLRQPLQDVGRGLPPPPAPSAPSIPHHTTPTPLTWSQIPVDEGSPGSRILYVSIPEIAWRVHRTGVGGAHHLAQLEPVLLHRLVPPCVSTALCTEIGIVSTGASAYQHTTLPRPAQVASAPDYLGHNASI
eukprot:489834-Rhodomonas_salina.5